MNAITIEVWTLNNLWKQMLRGDFLFISKATDKQYWFIIYTTVRMWFIHLAKLNEGCAIFQIWIWLFEISTFCRPDNGGVL
jgi:hypothetical protein